MFLDISIFYSFSDALSYIFDRFASTHILSFFPDHSILRVGIYIWNAFFKGIGIVSEVHIVIKFE
jgi:hypothetical protein